jgi:hypothetical protein
VANLADAMHHSQLIWKLKPGDADHNRMVREDFFYEQVRGQIMIRNNDIIE